MKKLYLFSAWKRWLLPCYFKIGRESQSKSTLQSLLEDRRSSRTLTGKDLNYLIVANWSGEKQFDLWVKFGTHSVCYSRPFHFIHTDGNWMAYFTWALWTRFQIIVGSSGTFLGIISWAVFFSSLISLSGLSTYPVAQLHWLHCKLVNLLWKIKEIKQEKEKLSQWRKYHYCYSVRLSTF